MTRYLEIKPGSISEIAKKLREDYESYFKKELEKEGKPITSMTDAEKKAFFNRVDKGWNAKNEAPSDDEVKKAPGRHSAMKGKLLLEPKKDDMKDQPNMQQEATYQDVSPSLENEAKDTMLVVNPKNKKPGYDGVKKINKKDWPEHQKQGYIQAEAAKDHKEPDADNMGGPSDNDADNKKKQSKSEKDEAAKEPYAIGMAAAMKSTGDTPPLKKSTIIKAHDIAKKIEKNEELTAAQKKLPPALQKAIDKKEKNEDVDADKMNKKQRDIKGEKEPVKFAKYQESTEEVELDEAGMKAIDTDNQELKRLRLRLTQLRDSEKAAAGDDTTNIEKQIHQTRSSILDLQKKQLQKQEDVDADKMNKKQKDVKGEKEPIKKIEEAAKKPNYKSYKKSLKKEEENTKNMKSTLTGKPVTKIDVEPKLAGHN